MHPMYTRDFDLCLANVDPSVAADKCNTNRISKFRKKKKLLSSRLPSIHLHIYLY